MLKSEFRESLIKLQNLDGKFHKDSIGMPISEITALLTHYQLTKNDYFKNDVEKVLKYFSFDTINLFEKDKKYLEIEDILVNNEAVFPPVKKNEFTFIDLFAGIGGFRLALQNLGGKCLFSSEWDKEAKKTYTTNFGEEPFGDITNEYVKKSIPPGFDVLCAGFPCQPFSKGGFQNGFDDTRGTLFFDICQIIQKHKPKFILLENVANLVTHDNKNTFKVILKHLDELGYHYPIKPLILSPDNFGIPVLRPRIYIPCVRKDISKKNIDFIHNFDKQIEKEFVYKLDSIDSIINFEEKESDLSDYELKVLKAWNDFYKGIDLKIIGFPIWLDFFKYEGDFTEFPEWKTKFIKKNIELYNRNKAFIDSWLDEYDNLEWANASHKKLEWQAGKFHNDLFQGLIQFRPSGIRVKKADKFSTLVAMNHQQIIGKLKRRITIEETKLLQSFPKKIHFES